MRGNAALLRRVCLLPAIGMLLLAVPAAALAAEDPSRVDSASLLSLTSRIYPVVEAPSPVGVS